MDITDTSYMDFLKIYFPDTANSINTLQKMSPQGKTPEEIAKSKAEIESKINAKLNDATCLGDYNAYLKIPETLRAKYAGTKVPPDMMEAARRDETLTLMEWEKHPEMRRVEDVRDEVRKEYGIPSGVEIPAAVTSAAALVLFASALKAGYSEEACRTLALHSQHRENLLEEKAGILTDPNLSETEKRAKLRDWLENKWLKSKKESVNTIKEDRAKNQPEKHLIYLLNKFNRGKLSKDELATFDRDVAELALRINTEGRQDVLLQYLKDHPAIVRHYKKPTLDILENSVLNKVPEAEREQVLARDFRKKRNLREEMSDDQKAATVAKDLKQAKANAMPEKSLLSTEEKRANIPTSLKRGNQRED